jgi:hypothetical protein
MGVTAAAALGGSPARQRQDVVGAEEALEAVVVEPHVQAVADQLRRHGVEHLAQQEAAAGGDLDGGLVEVGGAPPRQRPEMTTLEVDLRPAAGVATANQLGNEAAIGVEALERAATAQEQRLLDRALDVAVPALDGTVLVRPDL